MSNLRYAVTSVCIYVLSNMSLTVLNKLCIGYFPYANVLLVFQNTMSVLLVLLLDAMKFSSQINVERLQLDKCYAWIGTSIIYLFVLLTSLRALSYVTIPTVVVFRNLTSLVVAGLEYKFMGVSQSRTCLAYIATMIAGSLLYAHGDMHFHAVGYLWLLGNIMATGSSQIYLKFVMRSVNLSSFGMSYYNNVLSMPLFVSLGVASGEAGWLPALLALSPWAMVCVGVSTVAGFFLSVSGFALHMFLSATSVMILNNLSRIMLIVLNELVLGVTLSKTSFVGLAIVLTGGFLYSREKITQTAAQRRKSEESSEQDGGDGDKKRD